MTAIHDQSVQVAGHATAAAVILGSFFDYLPHVAALLGVVWYLILIYESKTGQKMVAKIKHLFRRHRHE